MRSAKGADHRLPWAEDQGARRRLRGRWLPAAGKRPVRRPRGPLADRDLEGREKPFRTPSPRRNGAAAHSAHRRAAVLERCGRRRGSRPPAGTAPPRRGRPRCRGPGPFGRPHRPVPIPLDEGSRRRRERRASARRDTRTARGPRARHRAGSRRLSARCEVNVVVDEGDTARSGEVGDLLRRADAADAPGVDLDEADLPVLHQMPRHRNVVRALAPGEAHGAAAGGERPVGLQGARAERLLEPGRAYFLEGPSGARPARSTSSPKICPTSTRRMPSGPSPSRAATN